MLPVSHVLMLDATALRSLEEVYEHTRARGVTLVLSGVTAQSLVVMVRSGFLDRISQDNVHGHIIDAIGRARTLLGDAHA